VSLSNANAEDANLGWESAFVRAVDDFDAAHLTVLGWFRQTPNQIGVDAMTNSDGDGQVIAVRWADLEAVVKRLFGIEHGSAAPGSGAVGDEQDA
jgi:hypothetical protein